MIRNKSSEELSHILHERGKEWEVAENQWFWVQEYKKVLLAELSLEYEKDGNGITKSEKMARVDPKFRTHLEAMTLANKKKNQSRVGYDEVQVEIRRRLNKAFTDRREMKSGSLIT